MSAPNENKKKHEFEKLQFARLSHDEQAKRSKQFLEEMTKRRSVRHFSADPVPRDIILDCIRTAITAPSGANNQPWHFALIEDPDVKRMIRIAVEVEETKNYQGGRLPEQWRTDIAKLGTDSHKPYIETVPYLIAVFANYKRPFYYVMESVGIAVGMLITALHNAGLATLPHTPHPMRFLSEILHRPVEEKAIMLLPVGYPTQDTEVPVNERKAESETISIF